MHFVTLAVLLLAIAYILYSFTAAYKLAYKLNHPQKFEYAFKLDVPVIYKKFDIRAEDGVLLKGIDLMPKMEPIGTILACHYLGGSKEAVMQFFDSLVRSGFRVVSFDFRNHGESESDNFMRYSLKHDFDAFYETIKEAGIEGPFVAMGFSMGATPALFALNKYPDIVAAIVDSGPLIEVREYFSYVLDNKNIKNPMMRFFFKAIYLYYVGFLRMANDTVKTIEGLKGKPVLMIHGEKDNIISIRNAEIAYDILKSEKSFLLRIPNSRHLTNKYILGKKYDDNIISFLKGNLCEGVTK